MNSLHCYKVYPFKVCNSVVLRILQIVQTSSSSPQKETVPISGYFPSLAVPSPSPALTHFLWTAHSGCCCRSGMSDSLRPHGLQHTRFPCPSPTPGAYSNSRASGSFPMSQLFASGGQSIGTAASVLPMNIQGRFL